MTRRAARKRASLWFTWLAVSCLSACDGDRVEERGTSALAETAEGVTPAPVTSPVVWGAAIGVSNLEAATAFFVEFFDLEVQARFDRVDRTDVVLWAKNKRGSRVTLSQFADGRNTQSVPAKLLFLVADPATLYSRLLAAGYASNFPPVAVPGSTESVAQIRGPDGYAIEISKFATDTSFFVTLGFAVDDATRSEAFYKAALGMVRTTEYPLGGTTFGSIELPDELVVAYTSGTSNAGSLVLMHYRSGAYPTKNQPVKSIHYVPDLTATVERAVAAGGGLITAPTSDGQGARLAVVQDPDGYQIELRGQ